MIHGVIRIIGGPAEIARGLGEAMRAGLQNLVLKWHREILPRHFQEDAYGRYGYQPRTAKYDARKMRKFGHHRPLVFASSVGVLERAVTSRIDVTGTSKQARGTLHAPPFMDSFTANRPEMPPMADELVRSNNAEEQEMGQALDEFLTLWASGKAQFVPVFQGGAAAGMELREQVVTF
jgi:hypothetical protein